MCAIRARFVGVLGVVLVGSEFWHGYVYLRLLCCACPLGGTNPNPDAPTMTPLDSIGPSVGGSGKTTGPMDANIVSGILGMIIRSLNWHGSFCQAF